MRELLAKATPGPWEVETESGQLGSVYAPSGMVAQAQAVLGDRHHQERAANGDLIAAMFDALPALLQLADAVNGAPVAMVVVKDVDGDWVLASDGVTGTLAEIDAMLGTRVRLVPDGGEG